MQFRKPSRLKPGDTIAVVSPSSGLAAQFPWVCNLGIQRIQEQFSLNVIGLSSSKKDSDYLRKNPQTRADDINYAFSDNKINGIFTTIGGDDQVRILPYLDQSIIRNNPKIFMGYSDNTNIHLLLFNLGIVSYYGASVMTQFAMQGSMHSYTREYIYKALFEETIGEIEASSLYTDSDLGWNNEENLVKDRPLFVNQGWEWHKADDVRVEGILWGGSLEIILMHLSLNTYMPQDFSNIVLYIETSEEMPNAGIVYRFFAALGERKILQNLSAILVGRPKAEFCGMLPLEGKVAFVENQKIAILQALEDYSIDIPVIFNLDFGHTDPQFVVPSGGKVIIDGIRKKIVFD
jgi:muramoyltetrapeptide carboxypeptidase LdcA involved in peptidoglycan recycling